MVAVDGEWVILPTINGDTFSYRASAIAGMGETGGTDGKFKTWVKIVIPGLVETWEVMAGMDEIKAAIKEAAANERRVLR
jgi:hypothetical protein